MRKLSLWLRDHPLVGDGALAALLALMDLPSRFEAHSNVTWYWAELTGLLLIVPLVARRRWPVITSCVILAGGFLQLFTVATPHYTSHLPSPLPLFQPADLALAIALYTLVNYRGRRVGALYSSGLLIGTIAWSLWRTFGADISGKAITLIMPVLVFAFSWALGEFSGARRAYHRAVEQRARRLEFERDQQSRIAVAEERNRIARELHDVLAHSVSVMVVQADGAVYALEANPEQARRALSTISSTGREALSELRGLLEVLRNPGEDDDIAPQPTATNLRELTERVRTLGLPVSLDVSDDLDELPAGVGLGVYRIVQESLTNALKHAGHRATASVSVARRGHESDIDAAGTDRIEIEVSDTGGEHASGLSSGGNGLIGMRERASVYGGTLEAGARPGGGWRVHAALPLETAGAEQREPAHRSHANPGAT